MPAKPSIRLRPVRFASAAFLLCLTSACATRPASAPVVAGLALRAASGSAPDTVVYERTVTRAGVDSAAGTRTVVSSVVREDGRRVIEVVQRFPGGGGEIVDTAIAEAGSWRALAHRSHQPAKTMRFSFDGGRAEGEVAQPADSAPRRVTQELGGPIFDSNVLELVVAALPLREGLRVELPFFIFERGGRVPMRVAVEGREPVRLAHLGERDAWRVTVAVPGAPATVWVDARTRAVLRVRYDIAARALSFTDTRLSPLGG